MTAVRLKAFVIGAVACATGALAAGCNLEPDAVAMPTYDADVRPIFMSRCIRCHGSPALGDPAASPPSPTAPINIRFDVFADSPDCSTDGGSATCIYGAAHEAMNKRFTSVLVTLKGKFGEMPPAPAPGLTSYQADTILKWESESPPLEK